MNKKVPLGQRSPPPRGDPEKEASTAATQVERLVGLDAAAGVDSAGEMVEDGLIALVGVVTNQQTIEEVDQSVARLVHLAIDDEVDETLAEIHLHLVFERSEIDSHKDLLLIIKQREKLLLHGRCMF